MLKGQQFSFTKTCIERVKCFSENPWVMNKTSSRFKLEVIPFKLFYYDFIFVTGIPITTTTALYTAIGVKMYTRENPGIQTVSSTARNRTVNRKVIAMLVTVEIVFCICWFPSWLALVCISPQPLQTICNSATFHFVRYFMSYSNSAITPYIYPIFNQNFRAGYVQIVNQVLNFCCGRICPRVATNQVFPLQERTTTHFRRGMRTLNTTRIQKQTAPVRMTTGLRMVT